MANPEFYQRVLVDSCCAPCWSLQTTGPTLKTHDINDILKTTKDMNPSFRDDYAQCMYIYIYIILYIYILCIYIYCVYIYTYEYPGIRELCFTGLHQQIIMRTPVTQKTSKAVAPPARRSPRVRMEYLKSQRYSGRSRIVNGSVEVEISIGSMDGSFMCFSHQTTWRFV